MAEIVPIVSEALEAFVRDNLPSQRGFGEDLQASNVIMPVLDITPTAEGTQTPQYLQTAWDFSTEHQNFTNLITAGTSLISTTGFWKVDFTFVPNTSVTGTRSLRINDGTTSKEIWANKVGTGSTAAAVILEESFIVFLRAGDSLIWVSDTSSYYADIWWPQVADVNGNLTNPLGFTPQ